MIVPGMRQCTVRRAFAIARELARTLLEPLLDSTGGSASSYCGRFRGERVRIDVVHARRGTFEFTAACASRKAAKAFKGPFAYAVGLLA